MSGLWRTGIKFNVSNNVFDVCSKNSQASCKVSIIFDSCLILVAKSRISSFVSVKSNWCFMLKLRKKSIDLPSVWVKNLSCCAFRSCEDLINRESPTQKTFWLLASQRRRIFFFIFFISDKSPDIQANNDKSPLHKTKAFNCPTGVFYLNAIYCLDFMVESSWALNFLLLLRQASRQEFEIVNFHNSFSFGKSTSSLIYHCV